MSQVTCTDTLLLMWHNLHPLCSTNSWQELVPDDTATSNIH